jgi:hypothetical protein
MTKGKDEPLPSADLRYGACAVARGYQVTLGYVTIGSPTARTLDTVLTERRECRADKMEMSAESYLVPFKGYADAYKGQRALECLSGRGYVVVDIPRMVDQADPMRPMRCSLSSLFVATQDVDIDPCITNRHHGHKKAGNAEAVIKDRRSAGRFRAFFVIRHSAAMSSSRLSGRPLASVALKWAQTNSSGFRSGA